MRHTSSFRRISAILVLVVALGGGSALSACGGGDAPDPSSSPSADAAARAATTPASKSSDIASSDDRPSSRHGSAGDPAASVGALPATRGTYVALADCTGSFRTAASEYLPEYRAFAQHVATARGVLRFGCLGGDALTTLRLETRDFSDAGRIAAQVTKDELRDRLAGAAALGTAARLRSLLAANAPTNGSDVYGALEHVAAEREVAVVLLLSDALHATRDGLMLSRASDRQVDAFARRTTSRMKHLRGVTVLALGVGRGAADNGLARKAERLLRTVVEQAGGRLGVGDSVAAAYSSIGEAPRATT